MDEETLANEWLQGHLSEFGLGLNLGGDIGGLGFGLVAGASHDTGGGAAADDARDYEDEVDIEIKQEGIEYGPTSFNALRSPIASTSKAGALRSPNATKTISPKRVRMEMDTEDYESHDEKDVLPIPSQQQVKKRKVSRKGKSKELDPANPPPPRNIKDVWPDFEKGAVLNFTKMLRYKVEKKARTAYHPPLLDEEGQPIVQPMRPPKHFRSKVLNLKQVSAPVALAVEFDSASSEQIDDASKWTDTSFQRALKTQKFVDPDKAETLLNERSYDLINLTDWESSIIYEPSQAVQRGVPLNISQGTNAALESGDWAQSIIWDRRTPFKDFTQLYLPEDEDEESMLDRLALAQASVDAARREREDTTTGKKKKKRAETSQQLVNSTNLNLALQPLLNKNGPMDKFNISNDRAYEISRDRHRVRLTLGNLLVQHSYPALKLQLPFYKTRLTKAETRSFHRPALQFHPNVQLHFSKVRGYKKKKDRGGKKVSVHSAEPSEALRYSKDITLKETGNFVLLEYSEEHPAMLNNFGMGSILVNYYRKKDEGDDFVPTIDMGQPHLLEPNVESPFQKFGSVDPGQTVSTLYNNLVRAPLFRHKAPSTDFLVVRSTVANETRYYLREIKTVYTVGQTFPAQDVPGPHSRKVTSTIKHRLISMVYKLLKKSPDDHVAMKSIRKYFPDQSDLQMRQRLKEFMEYSRTGQHGGFWRLKASHEVIPDARMNELLAPENICLVESMQVGQRHLQDSGYARAAEGGNEDDDAEGGDELDIEQQLAPWITTKNFRLANANKAMLKLHGPGDPTGRGEGFSPIRVSMKEVFVRAGEDQADAQAEADKLKTGHKYNVQQQQAIYRSEIDRIWRAQWNALNAKVAPELSDEEDEAMDEAGAATTPGVDAMKKEEPMSRAGSPLFSDRGESMIPGDANSKKKLLIRRRIGDKWFQEIVRDPNVITAYLKRRDDMELENMNLDDIKPSGDPVKDALIKAKLTEKYAKLQKNQDRRLQRKNAAIAKEGGKIIVLDRAPKPDTTRRCGHCGAIGHMKTNRNCPRWAEFNPGAAGPSGRASSPTRATGSGTMAMSPPPPSATGPGVGASSLGASPAAAASSSFMAPPQSPATVTPSAPPTPFRSLSTANSVPTIPSPLATSPPMSAPDPSIGVPAPSKPKLKLSLKVGSASSPPPS